MEPSRDKAKSQELMARALREELTPDEEKQLEEMLSESRELCEELDRTTGFFEYMEPLRQLSHPSIPTPASLENAMQEFLQLHPTRARLDSDEIDKEFESEHIELVRKIGAGGMGIVYEGFDRQLGRSVAVKILPARLSDDPKAKERLLREAQAAAQLSHENIVTIHSIQLHSKQPYIIQQLVRGETLGDMLDRQGTLSAEELESLAIQVTKGLSNAHRNGLIHRDLKPDNILIESESKIIRIADFGLARRTGLTTLTGEGIIAGTPSCMSPEQTRGEELDNRSDLFSLGCVLYRAAVGNDPFVGDDPYIVMDQIRTKHAEPISKFRKDLPAKWDTIVGRLLEKDRQLRYQSAEIVLADILGQPAKSTSDTFASRLLLAILTVAGLIVGSYALATRWPKPTTPLSDSSTPKNDLPSSTPTPWFEIEGTAAKFDSLSEAIASAKSGAVILVSGKGSVTCPNMQISDKKITIRSTEGSEVVLHGKGLSTDTNGPFIRTDASLTLIGLTIQSDRTGDFEMPIESTLYVSKGLLTMENCTIRNSGLASCVVVETGRIDLKSCRLIAPNGMGILIGQQSMSKIEVQQCFFDANCALMIVADGRQAGSMLDRSTLTMEQCTFSGTSVVRLLLSRTIGKPKPIQFTRCLNLCKSTLLLSTPLPRRDNLGSTKNVLQKVDQLVLWSEENCVHREGVIFLGTIPVRKTGAVIDVQHSQWELWASHWKLPTDTSIVVPMDPDLKGASLSKILSQLPEPFSQVGAFQMREAIP